jgi:coenzyme PQQ precursor peptide PqqA
MRQAATRCQCQEPSIRLACCRMYWTAPTFVEICIGLEINGYLPAEF